MKKIATLTLILVTFISNAQNDWDFFPTDSIRLFGSSGMGYRDSKVTSIGVVLSLENFSKYRLLNIEPMEEYYGETYYRTGNSSFGNHIIKTEKYTYMVLINDSIREQIEDSFTLLNTAKIGLEWICYEDSNLLVIGKNEFLKQGESPIGTDSIRRIVITTHNKKSGSKLDYYIDVGKAFGLFQFFDIASFIHFDHNTYFTRIYKLSPYKEITVSEFYTVQPGTETHTYTGIRFESDHWVIHDYYVTNYYLKDGKLVKDIIHLESGFQNIPDGESLENWDTAIAVAVVPEKTGDNIINPLPNSKSIFDDARFIGTYCEDGYVIYECISEQCSNSWEFLSKDTVVEIMGSYSGQVRIKRYHSGIGQTYESYTADYRSSTDLLLRTDYIKTKTCTIGEPNKLLLSSHTPKKVEVSLAPMPANDYIRIESDVYSKGVSVEIFDITGVLVLELSLDSHRLDVSSLPSGIYHLHFLVGRVMYTGKFIKI